VAGAGDRVLRIEFYFRSSNMGFDDPVLEWTTRYGALPVKIGRNAGSGRFTTVKQAQAKPKTHVVETVKPAGKPKGR